MRRVRVAFEPRPGKDRCGAASPGSERAKGLSRSRLLLVNHEPQSKTAWNEIKDFGYTTPFQFHSKIAFSWRM